MKIIDKIKPFYIDFLIQSTVFYIAIISPIGVMPYYMAGSAGTNSILWDKFLYLWKYFSISKLLETLLSLFIWLPLYSILLSAPLCIANIYILKINLYKLGDDDYLATKLLFMIIAGVLLVPYLLIIGDYHTMLYASFPTILTSIMYLLFIVYKENKSIS